MYTGQFGIELTRHLSTKGRRFYGWRYYAIVYTLFFLSKIKLVSVQSRQRTILTGLSGLMQGCTEKEALEAYQWMLEHVMIPTQRLEVVTRLREHQVKGHKVVIISGMLSPALELLRTHLGADGCIGTESEIRDGRYSGRSVPPAIMGADKAIQAREYFQARGMQVDWSASFAYGDSITDRDMLELVGHPVAVYPDRKLYALAQSENWEVLGTPKK